VTDEGNPVLLVRWVINHTLYSSSSSSSSSASASSASKSSPSSFLCRIPIP